MHYITAIKIIMFCSVRCHRGIWVPTSRTEDLVIFFQNHKHSGDMDALYIGRNTINPQQCSKCVRCPFRNLTVQFVHSSVFLFTFMEFWTEHNTVVHTYQQCGKTSVKLCTHKRHPYLARKGELCRLSWVINDRDISRAHCIMEQTEGMHSRD